MSTTQTHSIVTLERIQAIQNAIQLAFKQHVSTLEDRYLVAMCNLSNQKMMIHSQLLNNFTKQMNFLRELKSGLMINSIRSSIDKTINEWIGQFIISLWIEPKQTKYTTYKSEHVRQFKSKLFMLDIKDIIHSNQSVFDINVIDKKQNLSGMVFNCVLCAHACQPYLLL